MTQILNSYAKRVHLSIFKFTESLLKMSSTPSTQVSGNEVSGYILCEKDELDLGITLKGGQSFR